jgi:hypothetical protein
MLLREDAGVKVTVRRGCVGWGGLLVFLLHCSAEPAKSGSGTGGAGGTVGGGTATGGSSGGGAAGAGGAGTGGAGAGGRAGGTIDSGTGRPAELPNSDSQQDIGAFLENSGYKTPPWIAETAAPREGTFGTQHGSKVRVWENPPLVASLKGGRDGRNGNPYPDQWSMAVKEFYDDMSGELVGVAVAFKTTSGSDFGAWTYYCYGPDNRCWSNGSSGKDMPVYGKGSVDPGRNCGFCHGFSIFTIPP